jgi:hypothetical protein
MVNPQKLKEKWIDVRSKLVVMVKNYKQSGEVTYVDNSDLRRQQ